MLEAADVCPSCGRVHSEWQFGLRHGAARECPEVVVDSFPLITMPEPTEVFLVAPAPPAPATARRNREKNPPIHLGVVPIPDRVAELRTRSLGVPWLPPPDLGEVL